jgi:hypothetical protein
MTISASNEVEHGGLTGNRKPQGFSGDLRGQASAGVKGSSGRILNQRFVYSYCFLTANDISFCVDVSTSLSCPPFECVDLSR